MDIEAEAGIFYGYSTDIPKDEKIQELKTKAEKIDLKLIEIKEKQEERQIVLGKEVKKTHIPSLEKITAKEFLNTIINIGKTDTLIELEKELEVLSEKPKLIITGRKIND